MTVWTNSSGEPVTAHRAGSIEKQEMLSDPGDARPMLVSALRRLLSDSVSLHLRALGYHWNVTGSDFAEYHALFGSIYEEIGEAIDPIAEAIRTLGAMAPFRLPEIMALRSVTDQPVPSPLPAPMAADLLSGTEQIIESARAAFSAADAADEQGIANLIASRIESHQRHEWMLRSSLGG